jgi:hypothetical protein
VCHRVRISVDTYDDRHPSSINAFVSQRITGSYAQKRCRYDLHDCSRILATRKSSSAFACSARAIQSFHNVSRGGGIAVIASCRHLICLTTDRQKSGIQNMKTLDSQLSEPERAQPFARKEWDVIDHNPLTLNIKRRAASDTELVRAFLAQREVTRPNETERKSAAELVEKQRNDIEKAEVSSLRYQLETSAREANSISNAIENGASSISRYKKSGERPLDAPSLDAPEPATSSAPVAPQPVLIEGRCQHCGMPLPHRRRADTKFCSTQCKQAAHRIRNAKIVDDLASRAVLKRWFESDPQEEPNDPKEEAAFEAERLWYERHRNRSCRAAPARVSGLYGAFR